jgi:hypothetical protein
MDKDGIAEMQIRRTYKVDHLEPVTVGKHTVFDNQRHVYAAITVDKAHSADKEGSNFAAALERMVQVRGEMYIKGHSFLYLIDEETVEALDGTEEAGKTLFNTLDATGIHGAVVRAPKGRNPEATQAAVADISSLFMKGTYVDGKMPYEASKVAGTVPPKEDTESQSA